MLTLSSGEDGYPGNWACSCDTCLEAACTLCHTDSAFSTGCDEHIHATTPMTLQHERVWLCTVCEIAPAAFTCRAENAASLCTNCDIDIHSTNPLASSLVYGSSTTYQDEQLSGPMLDIENEIMARKAHEEIEEDETNSWSLLSPDNNDNQLTNSELMYGGEVDEYLDLVEYDSSIKYQYQEHYSQQQPFSVHHGDNQSDSVVPVFQSVETKELQQQPQQEYETSQAAFINTTLSSQSAPMPLINPGILPKATVSSISHLHTRTLKGTTDLFSNPQLFMPFQFTPMSREAKVLKYRMKRKARKFQKKIRYASRKAYAETRPRVKGRFARRTDRYRA